jgi:hypothetical protein
MCLFYFVLILITFNKFLFGSSIISSNDPIESQIIIFLFCIPRATNNQFSFIKNCSIILSCFSSPNALLEQDVEAFIFHKHTKIKVFFSRSVKKSTCFMKCYKLFPYLFESTQI